MNKKVAILKLFAVLVAISFAVVPFLYEVPSAQGQQVCHVKDCIIDGKNCNCCLNLPGSLVCLPCGGVECPPEG